MKKSLKRIKFEQGEEKSLNLMTGQWKIMEAEKQRKKTEEKQTEPKGPIEHH